MQDKPLRVVAHSEDLHGIVRHLRRRRHLGKHLAIRTSEPKLAVGLSLALVALLVNRAVVPATEQGQVRERGGTSLGPVAHVMALAER